MLRALPGPWHVVHAVAQSPNTEHVVDVSLHATMHLCLQQCGVVATEGMA